MQRLVQVVQSVADGAAWFDPSIAHIVLQATTNTKMNTEPDTSYKNYDLTAREAQILKLNRFSCSFLEKYVYFLTLPPFGFPKIMKCGTIFLIIKM